MRSSVRSVLVALVAVLALGAVVSASAFASPGWEVKEGGAWKALGAGESRNVVVEGGVQTMAWSYGGSAIVFSCGAAQSRGKIAGGAPGTGEVSSISYTECGVSNISGCEIKSPGNSAGKITTADAETTLVTFAGGGTGEKLSHNGGTGTWFEVEFGKNENTTTHKFKNACGALPTSKLAGVGTVVSKLETGAGGNFGETLVFTNPAQEDSNLTLAGKSLTLEGSEVQTLVSGEGEALRVAP